MGATAGAGMAMNGGVEGLNNPRLSDRLTEENQRLKPPLRDQERPVPEGFFGAATPASNLPVKPNTKPAKDAKRKGARPGPPGAGRQAVAASAAERVVDIPADVGDRCPACAGPLEDPGPDARLVLESRPVRAERLRSRWPKPSGPRGQRTFPPRVSAVLPTSLDGQQLLATAATRHSLHGLPLGRVGEPTGLGPGSLVEMFHRVARRWAGVPHRRVEAYRQAAVKPADETGGRPHGNPGDTWRFATPQRSRCLCRNPRAASVRTDVFGNAPRPGWLVVERSGGDHKAPGASQYRASHLLREVQDLAQECPEAAEVIAFVSTVAPLLSLAMGRRSQAIAAPEFYSQAAGLKAQLIGAMEQPAPTWASATSRRCSGRTPTASVTGPPTGGCPPRITSPTGICGPRSSPARSASGRRRMPAPIPVGSSCPCCPP